MDSLGWLLSGILLVTFVQGRHQIEKPALASSTALTEARQLIVVTTKDWNTINGQLSRYERAAAGQAWQPVEKKIPVVVGRNGLAWGVGLHGDVHQLAKPSHPIKKEGDGRAPAGIFSLSTAFGYAPRAQAGNLKLPYVQATKTLECVDDPKSANYNRLLERSSVAQPDWNSSEQMRRDDELYRLGVVVDHNANPPLSGCGSCIFLHIWQSATKGTAGCTAMEPDKIEKLLSWLDSQKKPLLVQLPQAEIDRLRDQWGVPR